VDGDDGGTVIEGERGFISIIVVDDEDPMDAAEVENEVGAGKKEVTECSMLLMVPVSAGTAPKSPAGI